MSEPKDQKYVKDNGEKGVEYHIAEYPREYLAFYCIWCTAIRKLVEELRHTKGRDNLAQHKIILPFLNEVFFQGRGRLEVFEKPRRLDIIVGKRKGQLRTTTRVESEKVLRIVIRTNLQVLDEDYDFLIIAFFQMIRPESHSYFSYECPYILTTILIDKDVAMNVSQKDIEDDVLIANSEATRDLANKMGIPDEIIIPCDNIIRVVDLERELEEERRQKDEERRQKEEERRQKEEERRQKDEAVQREKQALREVENLKKRLSEMEHSK